uniref:peptidyl-tRNA hydrolase n=1 Tax=Macrostomum lignano TaxID=282301 RepID=A0A1I8HAE7_9PLAT
RHDPLAGLAVRPAGRSAGRLARPVSVWRHRWRRRCASSSGESGAPAASDSWDSDSAGEDSNDGGGGGGDFSGYTESGHVPRQVGRPVRPRRRRLLPAGAAGGPASLAKWLRTGQQKVALRADGDENRLYELQAIAHSLGLVAVVIHDAGRTQIAAGSATVLGIGPGPSPVIDQVTGHLKLL